MSEQINYPLKLALRLLALWRERPGGVKAIERVLCDVDEKRLDLDLLDVTRISDAIDHLDAIRDTGPFVAPVDRSVLPQVTKVVDVR